MTSRNVRRHLVSALRLDVVGPEPGEEQDREVLPLPAWRTGEMT
jgi:hypothetical protein